MDPLYTPKEAAQYCSMTRYKFDKAVIEFRVPIVRLAKKIERYRREDLDGLLAEIERIKLAKSEQGGPNIVIAG